MILQKLKLETKFGGIKFILSDSSYIYDKKKVSDLR